MIPKAFEQRFKGSPNYTNDEGPLLLDSYLAFVDILGSKNFIKTLTTEKLRTFMGLLNNISPLLTMFDLKGPNITLLGFTDNIVIATPVDGDYGKGSGATKLELLIECAGKLQYWLMLNGIACRGGIVRGPVFLAEHFGTGQAIVDAYSLESDFAINPRIILSNELIPECQAIVNKTKTYSDTFVPGLARMLAIDLVDSRTFVSYLFAPSLEERSFAHANIHKEAIISALNSATDTKTLNKYRWLASYHNFVFAHKVDLQIQTSHLIEKFKWFSHP